MAIGAAAVDCKEGRLCVIRPYSRTLPLLIVSHNSQVQPHRTIIS